MPCYRPRSAARLAGGGIKFNARPSERVGLGASDFLYVPCGSCVGCLKSRARSWAIRCNLELMEHSRACWSTLTYDDAHLPYTLRVEHLQSFLKRLRERVYPQRVRFFACGEYGEQTGRPHYHAILYGTEDEKAIVESWPHGFARKERELTPKAIAYVAGYVAKKYEVHGVALRGDKVDYSTGEVLEEWKAPFLQMSRRPGIGSAAREHWQSWRSTAYHGGREVPVPRFLHERWKANASWLQQVGLAAERARERREPDWDRLRDGEVIAEAERSLSGQWRKL